MGFILKSLRLVPWSLSIGILLQSISELTWMEFFLCYSHLYMVVFNFHNNCTIFFISKIKLHNLPLFRQLESWRPELKVFWYITVPIKAIVHVPGKEFKSLPQNQVYECGYVTIFLIGLQTPLMVMSAAHSVFWKPQA